MASMTRHLGILGASCICLLLTVTVSSAEQASKITKEKILNLLKSIDEAAIKKDAKTIMAHMAPNAVIKMEMPGPEGKQIFRWNTKEYETNLKQSYAEVSDYQYKRVNTKIEIAKDGRTARVTDTVLETVSVGGQTIHSETKETALLEWQNGKLLITTLDAVVVSMQ